MKNNRMETLKANGVDTSKYFTLMVNNDIPAGTKINIEIDPSEIAPIAQQIVEDGYVKNTRLHRRFVAAQYFRMLESRFGWHGYLNMYYDYMYQFNMMADEVKVLSKLERKDQETYYERRMFFTYNVINKVLDDYMTDLKTYLNGLKIKHCKGRPYISIPKYGYIFCDEVEDKILNPISAIISVCHRTYGYANMYENLNVLKRIMIELPYGTKKSKTWVDAFQKEGAFYTLKNLVMFHDVKLYYDGAFHDQNESMNILKRIRTTYEGYQMNALLKETIKRNNFNFKKSIEAHR